MFNFLHYQVLGNIGLFTLREAQGFIRKRFADANVNITEGEIERALRLAGRYPFFLQQACFRLFEMKVSRATEWERAFRRDAKPHLQYLWNRLKSSERATLSRAIDLGLGSPDEMVIEDLEQRGLLARDDKARNGWSGFGEVFEEVVLNPPSKPFRDRVSRWWLPMLGEFEISLWPPSIKLKFQRPSDKQQAEGKR